MKILITLDEVKKIVGADLLKRGMPVKQQTVDIAEHIEGMYDDARQVVDGITFELEEKQ